MKRLSRRKPRFDRYLRREIFGAVVGLFLIGFVWLGLFLVGVVRDNLQLEIKGVALGATFSKKYSQELGLDWKKAYLATLDELGVRALRIPVYWDEIEPEPGSFNFKDVDWQIDRAGERRAKVVLAIGRKVPRWPECFAPIWAEGMNESLAQTRVLAMLERVVTHFQEEEAIVAWQVENEPLLDFGLCPPPDREFLKHEVAVVRALDKRPVIVTESGELSTWVGAASIADILGISTYRIVWNRFVGYFNWPLTPVIYHRKAAAVSSLVKHVILTELQAEPWFSGPTSLASPVEEQLQLMNPELLAANVAFARRIGFPEVYVWGIEWWYWLKERGYPQMWEAGKGLWLAKPPAQLIQ